MLPYKLKLTIGGNDYVIVTEDSEEYMLNLAKQLDAELKTFMEANPSAGMLTSSILTALSYLDELEKAKSGTDNMREQVTGYFEDISSSKKQIEESNAKINELKAEISRLNKEIYYLKELIE